MRSWWRQAEPPPISTATFSVTCVCGQIVHGPRPATFQDFSCSHCGAQVFVLPMSPWLDLARKIGPADAQPPSGKLTRRDFLLPSAASVLALALLVLTYRLWIAPSLFPQRVDLSSPPDVPTPVLAARLLRAQRFLAEGSFWLAVHEMDAGTPDLRTLTPEERRAWRQTHRQAGLLAELLSEPLEDILRHGASMKEQEWQADFRHRFLGKALVLDAEFRRPLGGNWEVRFPLYHGQDRARVVVEDLQLLSAIAVHDPQRLVVGARLASVKLELPGPAWVVRFAPNSGVFLTDPSAAARVCPAFAEPEAIAVLERQQRWVE